MAAALGQGCGRNAASDITMVTSALTATGHKSITVDHVGSPATFAVGAWAYNGCTPVTPVNASITISPNHGGTATTQAQNFTMASCPGVTFPGQAAYFTYNGGTVLPSSGTESFQVQFTSSAGNLVTDVDVAEGTPTKSQGEPQCCNASGNMASSGRASSDDAPISSANPSIFGQAAVGGPIDLGSGNVFYKHTDYTTAGQNPLAFIRYYNSGADAYSFATLTGTVSTSATSRHWRSNFDRSIDIQSANDVVIERPDGREFPFSLVGSSWVTDSDLDYTLTNSGTSWTLTGPDDTVETYTTTTAGTSANLNTITLRNGYAQTMSYTSGLLTSVSDSYSRSFTIARNSNGTIASVTTPDSTTITYGYNTVTGGNQLTTVTWPTSPAQTLTYVYGNSSLPFALTGVTDENGNTYQTWTYDSAGRGLTSAYGGTLNANLVTITYPTPGTTATVTNALGVTDTYTFTTSQNMPKLTGISRAATTTTAAATESFAYDSNGYRNSLTDWNGNQTTWVNNSHGLPTTINEAVGSSVARTTTIAYNATHVREPDTITSPGVTRTFTYDSAGDVLTDKLTDTTTTSTPYSTNGQTRTTTYTWSNHLLASVKTPNLNTTTFGYNTSGALTSITDPLSHVTSITAVTSGGRPLTIVDPNSVTRTRTYDARQRQLTDAVTMSGGVRTTSYAYDAAGNLTGVTLPGGSASYTNSYDHAHRLTQVTDAIGDYTTYSLDAMGDLTGTQVYHYYGSLYAQHAATFDALGRKLTDVGGRSQTTTMTYDKNGNMLTSQDGNSHTTTRTFDALNRVATSTDANSGVITPTYDTHDRISAIQDALGHSTTFVIDGFGDVIQQVSPDSGTTVYHFDSDANLTSKTDGASVVTNQTFDALDRPLTRTYPADSTQNVAFTYDQTGSPYAFGIGRLTSLTDAAGSMKFAYDERGATTLKRRTYSGTNYDVSPTYDAAGFMVTMGYPSGFNAVWGRYSQEKIGDTNAYLPNISGMGSPYQTYAWTAHGPFGPIDYVYYGNTSSPPRGNIWRDYDYAISSFTLTDGGTTNYQYVSYTRDGANNVTAITDSVNAANTQTLGYDVVNRLTSASSGTGGYGSLSWTLDKNGNLTSSVAGGVTTTYGLTSGSNKLASITVGMGSPVTVTSNGNGNITSIPPPVGGAATTLSYSVANRLSGVSGGGATSATYVYGAFGERVAKTVGGATTVFSYDLDGLPIEENRGSTATDYEYVDGWLVGLYIGQVAGGATGGTVYYIQPDLMGDPAMVTDNSATTVWSANRQPYGTTGTITSSITENIRLPGQFFDGETGFFQNGFRDYMPNLGRYVEADLIGLGGGMNPYQYSRANPFTFVDPKGLDVTIYQGGGHEAIRIDTPTGPRSIGFGPGWGTWVGAFPFLPTPGRIDEGNGYGDTSGLNPVVTYPLSPADGQNLLDRLRTLKQNPPLYSPLGFNCQQFACFVTSTIPNGATMGRCISPLDLRLLK